MNRTPFLRYSLPLTSFLRGVKRFPPPPTWKDIVMPPEDQRQLPPLVSKPNFPILMKYTKSYHFMRGPEPIHNTLMYNQYGLIALAGGRLTSDNIEDIRRTVNKYLDVSKSFAIWRIDPPWQSITRRGLGKRLGGGKGNIHHYATPVKAGRVIIEVGGAIDFEECLYYLRSLSHRMPMPAMTVSAESLKDLKKECDELMRKNINPLSYKRIVDLNINGVREHMGWNDDLWYGKYQ